MNKICLGVIAIVLAIGCSRGEDPSSAPPPAACSTRTELHALSTQDRDRTFDQHGICPRQWTCNWNNWYGSEAACNASCGSACWLEYRCGLSCFCP
jgi:hypothetical protein